MPSGGIRPGAGRPKGSKQIRSAGSAIRATKAEGKPLPLDFLLASMNDLKLGFKERLAAAIAAAPYVHPRLASIQVSAEVKDTSKISQELMAALKSLSEMARTRSMEPTKHSLEAPALITSLNG